MELNYFTKNPERASRMENWSARIKKFQDELTGMPDEDKMRLPGNIRMIPFHLSSNTVLANNPSGGEYSHGYRPCPCSPCFVLFRDLQKAESYTTL